MTDTIRKTLPPRSTAIECCKCFPCSSLGFLISCMQTVQTYFYCHLCSLLTPSYCVTEVRILIKHVGIFFHFYLFSWHNFLAFICLCPTLFFFIMDCCIKSHTAILMWWKMMSRECLARPERLSSPCTSWGSNSEVQ